MQCQCLFPPSSDDSLTDGIYSLKEKAAWGISKDVSFSKRLVASPAIDQEVHCRAIYCSVLTRFLL